jgi:phospholipid/cholesterol/gamma-HCH transport system substrate-binding protein
MASSRSREIRVGIVTVVALIALVGGIIWGKSLGFGVATRIVRITFPNASGVDVGTVVTLNGVRKGSVTAIDAQPDEVRITASVDDTFPLKADASAVLSMLEVTGGKKIELSPGKSPAPLPADAVIPGVVQGDITSLLAQVGDIAASASQVVAGLDSTVTMVNGVLGSREFRENITSTMSNLEQASGDARNLVTANRAAINRAVSNLDRLSSDLRDLVNRTRPAVERTLASAEDISADAKSALRSVDTTLRQANTLIAHLDTLAADIKGGQGAVSKIIYDKEFADELQRTLTAVKDLVQSIDKGGLKTRINIGFGK